MLISAYAQSSVASLICKVPALLTGVLVHSTDATGKVVLYDGQDTLSGKLFGNIASPTNTPFYYSIAYPVLFENGIYVDVVASIEDYTITYIPLRGNSPLRPYNNMIVDLGSQ